MLSFTGNTCFGNTGECMFLISSVPSVYSHFDIRDDYRLLNVLMDLRNLSTAIKERGMKRSSNKGKAHDLNILVLGQNYFWRSICILKIFSWYITDKKGNNFQR